MNIVSDQKTNNISHILRREILRLSLLGIDMLRKSKFFIVQDRISKKDNRQKWRKFVLSKIFAEVEYISKNDIGKIDNPGKLVCKSTYDCTAFIDYQYSAGFMKLIDLIKENVSTNNSKDYYVLLCQREPGSRYLIDWDTKLPLQDYLFAALGELNIPFKSCNFSSMTPREQVEICGSAKIFVAAHGAGNTNLIFTPNGSQILEFNFRKHWYCDPLCDQHFTERLAYNDRCEGELTRKPYFHKADYHNLARLFNKPYTEMEVEKYEGFYARENPICRRQLYVDGKKLLGKIKELSPELLNV